MTLRCARLVVVPTTGPRSAAVAAPHWIGRAPKPPACEVSRMWLRGGGVPGRIGESAAGSGGTASGEGWEAVEADAEEGVGTVSTDIAGPQKTQCTDGSRNWQAGAYAICRKPAARRSGRAATAQSAGLLFLAAPVTGRGRCANVREKPDGEERSGVAAAWLVHARA